MAQVGKKEEVEEEVEKEVEEVEEEVVETWTDTLGSACLPTCHHLSSSQFPQRKERPLPILSYPWFEMFLPYAQVRCRPAT